MDDKEVWQALPNNVSGWHAGDGNHPDSINRNSIGIEVAFSMASDMNKKDKAIENAARLTADLMITEGIPIENVISHFDASGKYCPHDIFDRFGWNEFIVLVKSYLE